MTKSKLPDSEAARQVRGMAEGVLKKTLERALQKAPESTLDEALDLIFENGSIQDAIADAMKAARKRRLPKRVREAFWRHLVAGWPELARAEANLRDALRDNDAAAAARFGIDFGRQCEHAHLAELAAPLLKCIQEETVPLGKYERQIQKKVKAMQAKRPTATDAVKRAAVKEWDGRVKNNREHRKETSIAKDVAGKYKVSLRTLYNWRKSVAAL